LLYRILDKNNDYSFGNSQLDFYKDSPEAVGQAVETRLLLWLGEWYLNTDDGTPYLQGVLGKHLLSVIDATIQDRVLGTENVNDISNYQSSIDPVARALTVSFSIDTAFGPTAIQIQNYALY
jgi:hypothetical protein